jgi:hypothetical protein
MFLWFIASLILGAVVDIKDRIGSRRFLKLVITLWLISVGFVLILLVRIDNIIHSDLYNFGLQYDFTWAGPYWVIFRLIYVCMVIPAALSVIALMSNIQIKRGKTKSTEVISDSLVKPVRKKVNLKLSQDKNGSMLINCHSCKRKFRKPLVMLDFSSGKGELINVCPYCNVKIGNEGKGEPDNKIKTPVQEPVEEKISSSDRP